MDVIMYTLSFIHKRSSILWSAHRWQILSQNKILNLFQFFIQFLKTNNRTFSFKKYERINNSLFIDDNWKMSYLHLIRTQATRLSDDDTKSPSEHHW